MGSQAGPPGGGPLEREMLPGDLISPSERERLLDALAASCAARGYDATTIDDVIASSRLSRVAFDRHFESKEACAVATIDFLLAEATTVAAKSYSPAVPMAESVMRGLLALLELSAARPNMARFAFVESRQIRTPGIQGRYRTGVSILTAMLNRLRTHVTGPTEAPSTAARGAFGGGESLLRRELLAGRAENLPGLLPDFIYGALVPFLDQKEALRYTGRARELLNEG